VASSYLNACVTHATRFKASPMGLKYRANLDPIATHLQMAAWAEVQGYFKP